MDGALRPRNCAYLAQDGSPELEPRRSSREHHRLHRRGAGGAHQPLTQMKKKGGCMSQSSTLKPLDGFANTPDSIVLARGTAVLTALTGNVNYPNPPVDLAELKAALEKLSFLIGAALDGSKKVVAEKNGQQAVVIRLLRLLGRYVEFSC